MGECYSMPQGRLMPRASTSSPQPLPITLISGEPSPYMTADKGQVFEFLFALDKTHFEGELNFLLTTLSGDPDMAISE